MRALTRLAGPGRTWACDMCRDGLAISRLDLAGVWLSFATLYFCMHGENCAGLFWQAIILALIVISLVD